MIGPLTVTVENPHMIPIPQTKTDMLLKTLVVVFVLTHLSIMSLNLRREKKKNLRSNWPFFRAPHVLMQRSRQTVQNLCLSSVL